MKNFGRILTAMITPFHDDMSVNYEAAGKLAQHLVANGSDGLVVTGSTGEAATLNNEEKLKLYQKSQELNTLLANIKDEKLKKDIKNIL